MAENDGAGRVDIEVGLHGGPLDGERVRVDVTDPDPWIAIIADGCAFPGGRALYAPTSDGRWVHVHDVPPEAI